MAKANHKNKLKLVILLFAIVSLLFVGCDYPEKTYDYEEGTFNLDDGTQFEGLMVNGLPLLGLATYSDGSIYDGSFENGIPHGYGFLVLPDSREIYGTWENGLCINGSYFFGAGYYDGQLKDYKAHGEGTLTFDENGFPVFWVGQFIEGKPTGAGKYIDADGIIEDNVSIEWFMNRY